jgi:gliding motility-associated-like protein
MNNTIKILLLLLVLSLLTLTSSAQCPLDFGQIPIVSTTGLNLYFPFNANATNQGSGSYTATVSGATYTTGICGQALDFDGVNDYVKITPYVPMTGSFTIATWVFIDSMTIGQEIFTTRDQCPTTYRGYSQAEFGINHYNSTIGGGANRIRYMVNTHQNCTGYSAGDRYYPPSYFFNSGSWHFVSISVQNNSSENRIVSFYIDCQLVSNTHYMDYPTSVVFGPGINYKTYIGAGSNVPNYYYSFNGKIDEFRLYNRVLSIEELRNLYYTCKPLGVNISKYIGNCTGDSALIELLNTQTGVSYQLFDSTNQQNIGGAQNGNCGSLFFNTGLITSPTDFYIKALRLSSNCKIVLDTIISLNPSSGGYQYHDSLEICDGDSTFIRGQFYTAPAIVSDTLLDINSCDSILTTSLFSLPIPSVDLGNDTAFCNGDSILLIIPNTYYSILWNTGSISNSIYINKQGKYWVKVSDSICDNSDSIQITNLSHTYININDTTFCEDEEWYIKLPSSNQYLWFNGSSDPYISIQDSGIYWVQITDICKNYTDTFTAHTEDCNCMMMVPNVFTPNEDGLNDLFFPVINCEFDEYHLVIYNRWGQLLFESFDQHEKWNGKYQDHMVADGVYFYLITYKHLITSKKERYRSGSITVFQ